VNLPPACGSRELFERALAGSSRALAADPYLQISIPAKDETDDQLAVIRGLCDAVAMKIRYHDEALHRCMSPAGPLARALYDELENIRVEAVACRAFSGVAANLAASFNHRYALRGLDLLESDAATPLLNAAVLMVRASLLDGPLPDTAVRLVKRWQDEIDGLSGDDIYTELGTLADVTQDQSAFAHWSRRFIQSLELVDEPVPGPQAKPAEVATQNEKGEAGCDQTGGEGAPGDSGGQESAGSDLLQPGNDDEDELAGSGDTDPGADAGGSIIPFPQNKLRDPLAPAPDLMQGTAEEPAAEEQRAGGASAYHAYATGFDQLVNARDLLDKDHLKQLRTELDQEISAHRHMAVRLVKRLQNSLRTLQKRAWTFDLDDGLLDTSHLSRLVIDPFSPLAYRQERSSETRDTVVSFLIDNSGSMRGRPIALAAMFADILAQALERCQVATEILGFTTGEWRGGQTSQSWRAAGRPADPGRLSDLRHVIYKTADEPWRRARQSLGVMLWPELLKENIDGEALLWAHQRLTGRLEQRRILIVISDGVPADDATLTANGSVYLDTHLRQVINWIETRSSVEMLAIGIGHDVSSIYQRSVTVSDSEQLGEAMAHELIELLGNVPSAARYPLAITN
jgi:cobaltochelatase CobT